MLSGDQVTAIWTTCAAAVGALGGAGLGGWITYRVTERQVTSSEAVAEKYRAHEKAMADEERRQSRIVDAYTVVMRSVLFNSRTIEWKLRDMKVKTDPPQKAPEIDPLSPGEEARASLVASGKVGALVRDFNGAIGRYSVSLGTLNQFQNLLANDPTSNAQLVQTMKDAVANLEKDALKAIDIGNALVKQMRTELGAAGDLPADTSGWDAFEEALGVPKPPAPAIAKHLPASESP